MILDDIWRRTDKAAKYPWGCPFKVKFIHRHYTGRMMNSRQLKDMFSNAWFCNRPSLIRHNFTFKRRRGFRDVFRKCFAFSLVLLGCTLRLTVFLPHHIETRSHIMFGILIIVDISLRCLHNLFFVSFSLREEVREFGLLIHGYFSWYLSVQRTFLHFQAIALSVNKWDYNRKQQGAMQSLQRDKIADYLWDFKWSYLKMNTIQFTALYRTWRRVDD